MKKAIIYTRTGDNGTTSLADGTRVAKNHPLVEAYGTLDELNSHIGLLTVAVADEETKKILEEIENTIFSIGCYIAAHGKRECPVTADSVTAFEQHIDSIEASLPPVGGFLLPGNTEASARANVCRTICRRAERRLVDIAGNIAIEPHVMAYINRLSDYLFLLQRQLDRGEEKKWKNTCK